MITLAELDLNNSEDVRFLYETRRDPAVDNMLLGEPPVDFESHRTWLTLNHEKSRVLFVIKNDDQPVGYCQMGMKAFPKTELGWVIASGAQGKGFGSRAVALLLNEAAKRGFTQAELFVKSSNQVARQIYLKHGFALLGEKSGVEHMSKPIQEP